jgi:hypothetical protein
VVVSKAAIELEGALLPIAIVCRANNHLKGCIRMIFEIWFIVKAGHSLSERAIDETVPGRGTITYRFGRVGEIGVFLELKKRC